MDRLGVFDQFFYKADQYNVISMIMGGASIMAPARPRDTLDANAIADHLAARLSEIPLLRVKFVQDPLRLGTVQKVEDPDFDIHEHISVTSLPAPGGYEELRHCLAKLSATPLPLSKLWHWTVIDGLQGGRLAIDCRIHHALADGVGIVAALSAMYDSEPVKPERSLNHRSGTGTEPSPWELLRGAVGESVHRFWVRTPKFLLRNSVPVLKAAGEGLRDAIAARNDPDSPFALPQVTPTSLNISGFSATRSLAWKTYPIGEVKALAKHFGCKVNDIGLLLFSFAMEHYLARSGEAVDFDLWCAMPISTRGADTGDGGNQVTVGRLSLHNTIPDAVDRLEAIRRDTQQVKDRARPEKPLLEIEELADVMFPGSIDALMQLAGKLNLLGRVGSRVCFANAILSNVPGPPVPVYVANGVMVESIPKIPALEVIAVSAGFTSVESAITIGFHCDGETVTRPDLFVAGVESGWKALQKAQRKPLQKPLRKKGKTTKRGSA